MDNFVLFKQLPVELRLMIWRHSLPGPRRIGVTFKIEDAGFGGWISTAGAPIALQVCRESRAEVLKHYVPSFGTALFPATVYFNHELDTLCFNQSTVDNEGDVHYPTGPNDYLLNLWHGKTRNGSRSSVIPKGTVRYLVVDVDEDIYSRASFCWEEIRCFDRLEKLLLVAWNAEGREAELMSRFMTALIKVKKANLLWELPEIEIISGSGDPWGTLRPTREELS